MARNRDRNGATETAERRRFGRFNTRLPIRTLREDMARNGRTDHHAECRLQLRDFSLGGLRAESPVPLKVNERLTLRLPPSGRHPSVQLAGRVIHCRRRDDRYHVGVAFREADAGSRISTYRHLPRLFTVATDFAGGIRPVENGRDRP